LVCGSRHFGKLVCRPFRLFPTIFFIFERPAVEVGALMSIFRIPEDKDEDCMKKTLAFLNEQLGLTFKESDIDRVHRVGRPRMNATRAMIVKFMAYRSNNYRY
jgi:hypothetical protein